MSLFLGFIFVALLLLAARFHYIKLQQLKRPANNQQRPIKTLIVLGSGGHTTEMLTIVKRLQPERYTPRVYVIAGSDTTSEPRIDEGDRRDWEIVRIFRSRSVRQSYATSVFTTVWSILMTIPILYRVRPQLILCNGPGTCVPICLIAFVFRLTAIFSHRTRIVFVESYCRVRTISLSGKILIWLADLFVVQWPQLQLKYNKSVRYYGRLL